MDQKQNTAKIALQKLLKKVNLTESINLPVPPDISSKYTINFKQNF